MFKILAKLGKAYPFDMNVIIIFKRKGLFRCKVFLYRVYILEQRSLDEMKGI